VTVRWWAYALNVVGMLLSLIGLIWTSFTGPGWAILVYAVLLIVCGLTLVFLVCKDRELE